MHLFDLGRIEVTPAASAALSEAGVELADYLARHRSGDWGEVEERRVLFNAWALDHQAILRSRYELPDGRYLLVATARDRSYTHVMLETEFERREEQVPGTFCLESPSPRSGCDLLRSGL